MSCHWRFIERLSLSLSLSFQVLERYMVGKVYDVPGPGKAPSDLFLYAAGSRPDSVRYIFTVSKASAAAALGASNTSASNTSALAPLDVEAGKFFVAQTGDISLTVSQPGRCVATRAANTKPTG